MNGETSCEKCIFAIVDKEAPLPVQVGCEFDRLTKFANAGIKVERREIVPKTCQLHYTIGAICNRCFQTDGSLSVKDYTKMAIERSRLDFDFIIAPKNLDQLKAHIEQFKSLTPQPNKLFVLDKVGLNREFAKILAADSIRWLTLSGVDVNNDDAIDKTEATHFWILDNLDLPKDILQRADDLQNEKMNQFFCVHGEHGILVNYDAYKMFVNKWADDVVEQFYNIDEKFKLKTGKRTFAWGEIL